MSVIISYFILTSSNGGGRGVIVVSVSVPLRALSQSQTSVIVPTVHGVLSATGGQHICCGYCIIRWVSDGGRRRRGERGVRESKRHSCGTLGFWDSLPHQQTRHNANYTVILYIRMVFWIAFLFHTGRNRKMSGTWLCLFDCSCNDGSTTMKVTLGI